MHSLSIYNSPREQFRILSSKSHDGLVTREMQCQPVYTLSKIYRVSNAPCLVAHAAHTHPAFTACKHDLAQQCQASRGQHLPESCKSYSNQLPAAALVLSKLKQREGGAGGCRYIHIIHSVYTIRGHLLLRPGFNCFCHPGCHSGGDSKWG